MGLKIVVLAKQVPDTQHVGKDAMKEDGTVNRAALPAIFNPEDKNALEQALRLKDRYEGTTVQVLTMGPARAAEIIREALYRGADGGAVLSGREFAGSDTLATSYAISCGIKNFGDFDMVLCGRQAIDGDTAQVGPQVAEKLGLPQVTYAEEIVAVESGQVTVKRRVERGVELVKAPLPAVITVNGSAAECRSRNAKRVMRFKRAIVPSEAQAQAPAYPELYQKDEALNIKEWGVKDIETDVNMLGLKGSPTKVKEIQSVSFQAKESKRLTSSDEDIDGLMKELIGNNIIG
jgi:electron transfer flavoprotein beta subunit